MIVYHGTTMEIQKPDIKHSKAHLDLVKEFLEEKIINQLAETKGIPIRQAMDLYYRSMLSQQIFEGSYGIENMGGKCEYRLSVAGVRSTEPRGDL